ncbi:hypothetical protein [Apilactobacillus ozensis]|uniref:hypothetical protein n=1 Tax=Apilactobacillus ozensis TaxID=866801 RepID=UPI00200A1D0B|nr:hypothetical protein [Apilactobacillus ozensis]MCK8607776.1 hypothetical protein [Apilactobacillus ozensis]
MDLSSNKVSNSLMLILLVSLSSLSSHLSGLMMILGYLSVIMIIFVKKVYINVKDSKKLYLLFNSIAILLIIVVMSLNLLLRYYF